MTRLARAVVAQQLPDGDAVNKQVRQESCAMLACRSTESKTPAQPLGGEPDEELCRCSGGTFGAKGDPKGRGVGTRLAEDVLADARQRVSGPALGIDGPAVDAEENGADESARQGVTIMGSAAVARADSRALFVSCSRLEIRTIANLQCLAPVNQINVSKSNGCIPFYQS